MATGTDWRASDAERAAVADQLREHYALGRLSMGEFRARLDAAYDAVTAGDLARVTADLPAAAGPAGPLRSHPAPARRRQRRAAVLGVLALAAAAITGAALLIGSLPHGGLLVLVFLLVLLPLLALGALAVTLIWVGRKAWRSGAWLEMVPLAAGLPWLGRVVWLARAVLVSRAFWRLGRRVARPLRGRRIRARGAGRYPGVQQGPAGPWTQPRVGDLSGTTR